MPVPLMRMDRVLERYSLSDFLPYAAYDLERRLYVLEDGRLGCIWTCPPLVGLGTSSLLGLTGLCETDLPVGTTLQFAFHASQVIEPLMDLYVAMRDGASERAVHRADAKRIEEFYLRARDTRLIPSSGIRPRDCNLYMSVILPTRELAPGGLSPEDIVEKLNGIEKVLTSCGFHVRRVEPYELLMLLHVLLNPGHSWAERPTGYDPRELLAKQAVRTDTVCQVGARSLYLDRRFVKCLTVQQFPERWEGVRNRELIGSLTRTLDQIAGPFWLTLNMVRMDPVVTGAEITRKHVLVTNQAMSTMLRLIPILEKKKTNFDLMSGAISEGHLPVGMYFQVLLYGEDESTLERLSHSVQALYRTYEWLLQEDHFISLHLFLYALPMGLPNDVKLLRHKLRRLKTVPSHVPPEVMPVVGDWKGYGPPVLLLTSRCGQVMSLDLFANPSGNYSVCVAGLSGAGKSFLVNALIQGYVGVGARVWMIDAGESYLKLCAVLGGQFIQFSKHKGQLPLNPLSRITVSDEDEMAMVKAIFGQMCSPSRPLSDLEMSWLEQAIKQVAMDYGTQGTPTHVASMLHSMGETKDDLRAKDLADMLFPFTKDGVYGKLFHGTKTLDFTRDFVVLELDGMDALPELRSVVLLQTIMNIQTEMYQGDRAQRKICGIDEAWDLLSQRSTQGGNVSAFFNKGVRRVRKYGGSILTITQGLNDYYNVLGETGRALLENSDYIFLLKQKAESLAYLQESKRLVLSEQEFQLLNTVSTVDNYSEIFLYTPVGRGIARLVVDDYTKLLYTTKAGEVELIKKHMEGGFSTDEAIRRILEGKGAPAPQRSLGDVV